MSSAHNKSSAVAAALAALDAGAELDRLLLRDAVRELLRELAERVPGRSVEVRVPPYGVIQCCPGPRHTRGTPPNVVESDPMSWLLIGTGRLSWAEAVADGRVRISGNRADISPFLGS